MIRLFLAAFACLLFTLPATAKTITIQAEGMMCQACAETVTEGFHKFDSESMVDVNLETQIVTVTMADDTQLSPEMIEAIFTERGYRAISIESAPDD